MNNTKSWTSGTAPVAVVLISFNEAHNLGDVLDNLAGWAQEVFLVDSYSTDATVDIALARGVGVVQRRFDGFGRQWDFAVNAMPISAPWTMKLDPDERLSAELKLAIEKAVILNDMDAFYISRRLWFMGRPISVHQKILRLWRTGSCRFPDVAVNEQPLVLGRVGTLDGVLEHHDSPTLHHWFEKQNRYTTAEALMAHRKDALSARPYLLGDQLQRRMWLKRTYAKVPFRHVIMFTYCLLFTGAWRSGYVGFVWARLRAEVHRMIDYKRREMAFRDQAQDLPEVPRGAPRTGVLQADELTALNASRTDHGA